MANCTRAVEWQADCIGIDEGDEVIVRAITSMARALAALQQKARPAYLVSMTPEDHGVLLIAIALMRES